MKHTKNVAKGGILTALMVVVMCLSGIFPTLSFTLAAAASGIMLVAVIEVGLTMGFVIYLAVSILSVLLVPAKDTVVLFVALLGYYPMFKAIIERRCGKVMELVFKFLLLNIVSIVLYFIFKNLFLSEVGGNFIILIGALVIFNITFYLYDRLLNILANKYFYNYKSK